MTSVRLQARPLDLGRTEAADWNSLAEGAYPFLRHEFLYELERTGCVAPAQGWQPCHIGIYDGGNRLVGAAPAYLKSHSRGEYVFDWAWADAYQHHGIRYYPKIVVAVPFTPVAGPRLLVPRGSSADGVRMALARGLRTLADHAGASSVHCLFAIDDDLRVLQEQGYLTRHGNQFHWHNAGYRSFDEFLSRLTADKRKKIRRERRRVTEQGVRFEWRAGPEISDSEWKFFTRCYQTTVHAHGGIPYLSESFFLGIGRNMPGQCLLLLASRGGLPVASALFLCGGDALYGRYWGATEWVPDIHFEACYYQAIEYCIRNDLERFEAGAQGEHKLARGLLASQTRSAHWLRHPEFARAVESFLDRERVHVEEYTRVLNAHSPFRQPA